MSVLVLNSGSSTLKLQLVLTDLDRITQNRDERFCRGLIERIRGEARLAVETALVILTGGTGENSPEVRRRISEGLERAELRLDEAGNQQAVGSEGHQSSLQAYVIPTDEELLSARDTVDCIANELRRSVIRAPWGRADEEGTSCGLSSQAR
jgi:acetate kinase